MLEVDDKEQGVEIDRKRDIEIDRKRDIEIGKKERLLKGLSGRNPCSQP
jgi:hypothetical protein